MKFFGGNHKETEIQKAVRLTKKEIAKNEKIINGWDNKKSIKFGNSKEA
jgi:hypothetical protein